MKNLNRDILLRIILIYSVLFILLLGCCWHFLEFKYSIQVDANKKIAEKTLSELEDVINIEGFLAKKIHNIFDSSTDHKQLKKRINLVNNSINNCIKYLIWTPKNNIVFENFDSNQIPGSISDACQSFYDLHVLNKYSIDDGLPEAELVNVHKVFGNNLFPGFTNNSRENCQSFLIPNSRYMSKKLWTKSNRKFTLVAFIDFSKLIEDHFYKAKIDEFEKYSSSVQYAICKRNRIITNNTAFKSLLPKLFESYKSVAVPDKIYKNYVVISKYINDETKIFAFVDSYIFSKHNLMFLILFIMTVMAILLVLFSYHLILNNLQSHTRVTLQYKLAGLFVLFNLIPMVVLVSLGHDYLVKLKKSEIALIYDKSISYLEHVDDMYLSEKTLQINSLIQGIESIKASLKQDGITEENITKFLSSQYPKVFRLTLIGSTTKRIATEKGIQVGDEKLRQMNFPNISRSSFTNTNKLSKMMITLSRMFITRLNEIPVSVKMATEFEFMTKAVAQTSPLAMIQNYYEQNGKIFTFGLGDFQAPIFLYMFGISEAKLLDYILLYSWRTSSLIDCYIKRLYLEFNKNDFGLKVMIFFPNGRKPFPSEMRENKEISKFALNLKNASNRNYIQKCLWKGKPYYLMGFKGQKVKALNFIGLYPCSKIDKIVNDTKGLFLLFGTLGFLISILFGLSISRQIMLPIGDLKIGISALKNHDFSYKIPKLGNDEFGNIAQIINETIEDMKELQKTEDLTTKMFANTGKIVSVGNSSLFGNASVFTIAGKDYLDVFQLENENKIGIVWGLIDKLGVASTLLAAYLRSSTIACQNLEGNPQEFVDKVSSLVNKINETEQSKVISFQYLVFDSVSNVLEISNFGCQLPIIIRENQEQPILGKIGKQNLKSKDALVAFSPLFKDVANFNQYLLETKHIDPEVYYTSLVEKIATDEPGGMELTKNSSLVILSVGEPT